MTGKTKTFTVVGSSGRLARAVTERLITQGHHVRPIARDPRAWAAWERLGAHPFLLGASSANVAIALKEVDGVLVISPGALELDDRETLNPDERDVVIHALGDAKAPTVLLSSMGAHREGGPGLVEAAREWEGRLRALVPLRIIRRAFLVESFAPFLAEARVTGRLRSLFALDAPPIPVVATADVAQLVTQWLERPMLLAEELIELEGPRRFTPTEMATLLAATINKPVSVAPIDAADWPALWRSLGGTPELGAGLAEVVQAFNAGRLDFEGRARRAPTPIDGIIPALLRP